MIMIYNINDTINYNTADSTIRHFPTNEFIKLSISSGRLFEQLLDSKGEILSREYLMAEVWDKYGLSGTNSNLNQYISMLRRILADYGCDNLIITIPKIGLRINTDIPIQRELVSATSVIEDVRNDITSTDRPIAVMMVSKKKQHPTYLRFMIPVMVVIALALLATWLYMTGRSVLSQLHPVYTLLDGGCELVLIKNTDEADRRMIKKQLKLILQENKLPCDSNRRLYFDNLTSYSTQNYGRTLLSYCHLGSNREIISCDNIYYINWRLD
jgi:DNA-binding winged helix-turn-helix (wHTH) protein